MGTRATMSMMSVTKIRIPIGFSLGILSIATGCEDPVEDIRDAKPAEVEPNERLGHYAPGRPVTAEEIAL